MCSGLLIAENAGLSSFVFAAVGSQIYKIREIWENSNL